MAREVRMSEGLKLIRKQADIISKKPRRAAGKLINCSTIVTNRLDWTGGLIKTGVCTPTRRLFKETPIYSSVLTTTQRLGTLINDHP